MKERPILFSGPMVRALLDGTKTQTRRVVKLTDLTRHPDNDPWYKMKVWSWRRRDYAWTDHTWESLLSKCPYGRPGDRLWVRETWVAEARFDHLKPSELPSDAKVWYLADGPAPDGFGRYRHARFMPRRLSRSLDEIVSIRVERLEDITIGDVKAEGIAIPDVTYQEGAVDRSLRYFAAYSALWESINGHGSWDENPYVWVVEFKRVGQ